ncbi:MAG: glycosyltransferase family 2 protein [Betaproteobacteria bacterium]|nr:glycosyltransferase family 2 protein [Betaproteobacteria bacterium]
MLGFFFRHYDDWIDRYVIYDDGSTDGSLDILHAHPKVEVRKFVRTNLESFVLSHTRLQNEVWQESRGKADWIVVTALDEHLWVPERSMTDYLAEQRERGATLIPALGFNMVSEVFPPNDATLVQAITRGCPAADFNKLSIFNPDALQKTNFNPGRHNALPKGRLWLPARDELMLWHFKNIGFERTVARETAQGLRLGSVDKAKSFGSQYLWDEQRKQEFWKSLNKESMELSGSGFKAHLCCARPLWWEKKYLLLRLPQNMSLSLKFFWLYALPASILSKLAARLKRLTRRVLSKKNGQRKTTSQTGGKQNSINSH